MNKILCVMSVILLWCGLAYSQNQGLEQTIGQLSQVMTEVGGPSNGSSDGGLFAGFSLWGILGGFIFGSIGFIAFIYGKKHAEYQIMGIGIAMMVYPYFIRGTIATYVVGVLLTAALYFFR